MIAQGKNIEDTTLLAASGAILLLAGAAYIMSLKDKLSLDKVRSRRKVNLKKKGSE